MTATVSSSLATVGTLKTSSGSAGTRTVTITAGNAHSPSTVVSGGLSFDPLSVMLYPIDSRLTLNGFSSQWNTAMSTTDKEWLAKMYPAADAPPTGSLGGRVWVELSKDGKGFNINYEGRQASVRLLDGGKFEGTWS